MKNEIRVRSTGTFRWRTRHVFPARTMQSARIIHVLSGRLHYVLDGRSLILSPGDICLLGAGLRDASHVEDGVTVYDGIFFDAPAWATRRLRRPYLVYQGTEPFRSTVGFLIRSVIRTSDRGLRRRMTDTAVRMILYEDPPGRVRYEHRIEAVMDEVETDPRQKRTIGDLASVAGVSESQLRRLFKRELGVLPKQYLMRARMEYARRLIRSEPIRVKEVAHRMGFGSAFEFSAQYRKVHGIPPGRDRQPR